MHVRPKQLQSNSHVKTIRYVVPMPTVRTVIIKTIRPFLSKATPLSNRTMGVVYTARYSFITLSRDGLVVQQPFYD